MKNSHKSVLKWSVIMALVGMPAALMADQITFSQNAYSYGNSGEFTVAATGQSFSGNRYTTSTIINIPGSTVVAQPDNCLDGVDN